MDYARELGRAFLAHDFALVYGGGALGLMGALASTVHEGGGKVTGVITEASFVEVQGITVGETEVVRDLQERKARFNQLVGVLAMWVKEGDELLHFDYHDLFLVPPIHA